MEWTVAAQLRLAYATTARELADRARAQMQTYADGYAHGAEFFEHADQLVAWAEDLRRLAVAYERQRGTSWEELAEVTGITRQAAHERWAGVVEELTERVVLPERELDGRRQWVGLDGLEDPDAQVAHLDAYAARHAEAFDGGRDHRDELVSAGLRERKYPAVETIATSTWLAGRLARHELPEGVSEERAREILDELHHTLDRLGEQDTTST